MINITVDMAPVAEYAEYAEGLAAFFGNTKTRGRIATRVAESSKNQFNLFVDAYADGAEKEIGHMYDWGQLGEAEGRLWDIIHAPSTPGARVAEYRFLPSTKTVPVGPEVSRVANDTRRGGHIFKWKASVIELGTPVHIAPTNGDWLAFPGDGEMQFTQSSIYHSGNYYGRGKFADLWLTEMTAIANRVVELDITASAERFIAKNNASLKSNLSKSTPGKTSNFKPKKNMKAKAYQQGELWLNELDTGTNIQRGIQG